MYLDVLPAVKQAKHLGNIDDDLPDHRPHLPSILQCQRAKLLNSKVKQTVAANT